MFKECIFLFLNFKGLISCLTSSKVKQKLGFFSLFGFFPNRHLNLIESEQTFGTEKIIAVLGFISLSSFFNKLFRFRIYSKSPHAIIRSYFEKSILKTSFVSKVDLGSLFLAWIILSLSMSIPRI